MPDDEGRYGAQSQPDALSVVAGYLKNFQSFLASVPQQPSLMFVRNNRLTWILVFIFAFDALFDCNVDCTVVQSPYFVPRHNTCQSPTVMIDISPSYPHLLGHTAVINCSLCGYPHQQLMSRVPGGVSTS